MRVRPQDIIAAMDGDEARDLIGDLSIENRSLRINLARYIERYGLLQEPGQEPPAEPIQGEWSPMDDAPAEEPAPEG